MPPWQAVLATLTLASPLARATRCNRDWPSFVV
eukprot:SAG31_NODE_44055_length_264_cov_0.939394_1_plen_32_part_01